MPLAGMNFKRSAASKHQRQAFVPDGVSCGFSPDAPAGPPDGRDEPPAQTRSEAGLMELERRRRGVALFLFLSSFLRLSFSWQLIHPHPPGSSLSGLNSPHSQLASLLFPL